MVAFKGLQKYPVFCLSEEMKISSLRVTKGSDYMHRRDENADGEVMTSAIVYFTRRRPDE